MAEIVADRELHREAKALAPILAAIAAPCGEDAVRLALGPLVLVFGVGAAANAPAFWRVYLQALSDIPAQALTEAIQDYANAEGSDFFPKPGPLRALAERRARPIRIAASRARKAAETLPPPVYSPDAMESRRALVAELLDSLKIKKV